jgi:beta-lactamase regulating signal transducer with metallopeptidase domain
MGAITYLLQVSGCMAIFYLFYYLLLNRLTFFTINRYYLVVTLVLSFVIPALTIPVHDYTPVVQHTVQVNSFKNVSAAVYIPKTATTAATPEINWLLLLKVGYLLVAAGLFVRLIIMLAGFFARLKNKQVKKVGNINIVHGNKQLTNGSFLNYIFLDDAELSPSEIQQIIAHEMLHVKLMHSVDRILVKIIQIVLWFNPFAYLYACSIEENHEFEVDREIALSTDKTEYADLLLHLSVAAQGMIYNNFSTVPLKKRIIMLFNQPSAKVKRMVYILVVPVLILSCMAFATFKTIHDINKIRALTPLKKTSIGTAYNNEISYNIIKGVIQNEIPTISNDNTDSQKLVPQQDTARRYSQIHGLEYLGKNPLVLIDGKEYPPDILYKIGKSCIAGTGVFPGENAVKKYGQKAVDGCVEIRTKNGQITYATPIDLENTAALASVSKSQFIARVTLKNQDGSLYDRVIEQGASYSESMNVAHNAKVAFFIDTVFYSEDDIKKLSPDKIASLNGIGGVRNLDAKKMENNDLHGYESVFFVWPVKQNISEKEQNEKLNYSFEKLIPIK